LKINSIILFYITVMLHCAGPSGRAVYGRWPAAIVG